MVRPGVAGAVLLALAAPLWAQARPASRPAPLPPVPVVRGPLRLAVIYPTAHQLVEARDSSFVFGSVGTGAATLRINGQPVRVWPNGAWLGWIALPADTAAVLRLVATLAGDSAVLEHPIRRRPAAVRPSGLWLDATTATPRGALEVRADEWIRLAVRAAPGAQVALVLPGGARVPLVPDATPDAPAEALRNFETDSLRLGGLPAHDRHVGVLRGVALAAGEAFLVATLGGDTVSAPWPVTIALLDTLPRVVVFDDDPLGAGDTDSTTIGRPTPDGTFTWFFPTGTRAEVLGRRDGMLRVRLSGRADAWVPAAEARALRAGTPPPRATMGSLSVTPAADRLLLRVPLDQRIPFRVDEDARTVAVTLYGARADADWVRHGPADPLLERVWWTQQAEDEVRVDVELRDAPWGWRARWAGTDLIVELRRPPRIDPVHPLRGRRIAIDPGHPPLGATGPTGLTEAEANLAVAEEVRRRLEALGARVLMTRRDGTASSLLARTRFADSVDAEVLVSIHNNALPDGVNPFTSHGTSVFYNHPRARPLAARLQAALLRRLGLPDLGISRADLHLTRPTWMPAVLTEGMFMMLPEQEAALRTPEGQRRYAAGVVEGLAAWLRDRARAPGAAAGAPGR